MTEQVEKHEDLHTPGVAHETRDISTRAVIVFGASLVIGAIVVHFLVWVVYVFYGSIQDKAYPREYPMAQTGAPPVPPAPRLQTRPREELKNMRAEEERRLNSYGCVHPSRGEAD